MADQDQVPAEAQVEKTEAPTLRDTLEASFKAIEEREAAPVEKQIEKPAEAEKPSETPERPRDEHGRFAPKTESAPQKDAPKIADKPETKAAEGTPQAQPSPEAPASLSAPVRAMWPTLPLELRTDIARRESEAHAKITELGRKGAGAEAFEKALEPVQQQLRLSGVEPAQYVRQLVAAEQALRTDPAGAIQWLAKRYGIDLSAVGQQQTLPVDPSVAAIQQEVLGLKSYIAQTQQQQAAQQQAQIEETIQAFASDPKHQHFPAVKSTMGRLINAGVATSMEDAYTKACALVPEVATKIEAERKAAAEQQAKADAEKRAAEAQKIAKSNVRTTGTTAGSPTAGKTMRESLERAYNRATAA